MTRESINFCYGQYDPLVYGNNVPGVYGQYDPPFYGQNVPPGTKRRNSDPGTNNAMTVFRNWFVCSIVSVLAENAHPFGDPPLRMDNPFGLFGLTS